MTWHLYKVHLISVSLTTFNIYGHDMFRSDWNWSILCVPRLNGRVDYKFPF